MTGNLVNNFAEGFKNGVYAHQKPLEKVVTVNSNFDDFDETMVLEFGPVVQKTHFWDKISEDREDMAYRLGESCSQELIFKVAREHNPYMEKKPPVQISEPYYFYLEFDPVEDDCHKFYARLNYKIGVN